MHSLNIWNNCHLLTCIFYIELISNWYLLYIIAIKLQKFNIYSFFINFKIRKKKGFPSPMQYLIKSGWNGGFVSLTLSLHKIKLCDVKNFPWTSIPIITEVYCIVGNGSLFFLKFVKINSMINCFEIFTLCTFWHDIFISLFISSFLPMTFVQFFLFRFFFF